MRVLIPVVCAMGLLAGCDDAREELVLLNRDVYALNIELDDVEATAGADMAESEALLQRLKQSSEALTARVAALQAGVREESADGRAQAVTELGADLDSLSRELSALRRSLAEADSRLQGLQDDLRSVEQAVTEVPLSAVAPPVETPPQ